MVPKLHAKGSSFKGAAAYLLHDKDRADTSERVAWTQTRNLAVEDPHVAWRVMAATAMDQDRLKQQAGIKNTGRKSNASVLHFSLSWHEDEKDGLDRSDMVSAAEAAIAALGADDRQAMIVCHDDEPHPHVHILLNRVSADDGRMLSSSKEKLNLSRWAEAYEKERGKIYCDQRVINNAARDRGEYTRGDKDQARHLYEQQKKLAGNDNSMTQAALDEQKRKDAAIAKRRRDMKVRHAAEFNSLDQKHKERIAAIRDEGAGAVGKEIAAVRGEFRPRWEAMHHEQKSDLGAFKQREDTFLGRMQNRFKAIDLRGMVRGEHKRRSLGEAFGALASKGARLEALKRAHANEKAHLEREQKQAEVEAARKQQAITQQRLVKNRQRFVAERSQLVLAQQMDRAALRAEWLERHRQRMAALEEIPTLASKAAPENRLPATDEKQQKVEQIQDKLKKAREERQRRPRRRR